MDPIRPLVVAGADYASSHDAAQDYQIVWTARHGGAFDHMSIALLTRDACGELQVERHNSAAKDLAWAGVVLRAALLVVVPSVRMATVAAGGAGAGGIAAHLRRMIPEEELQGVSHLLDSGESGLLVVAIDRKDSEISPLFKQAEKTVVIQGKTGDLDAAFYGVLRTPKQ
jgi:hypothetical protein